MAPRPRQGTRPRDTNTTTTDWPPAGPGERLPVSTVQVGDKSVTLDQNTTPAPATTLKISPDVLAGANPNEATLSKPDAYQAVLELMGEGDWYPTPNSSGGGDSGIFGSMPDPSAVVRGVASILPGGKADSTPTRSQADQQFATAVVEALPPEALRASVLAKLSISQLATYVQKTSQVPSVRATAESVALAARADDEKRIDARLASLGITDPDKIEQTKAAWEKTVTSTELAPNQVVQDATLANNQVSNPNAVRSAVASDDFTKAWQSAQLTASAAPALKQDDFVGLFRDMAPGNVDSAFANINQQPVDSNGNPVGTPAANFGTVALDGQARPVSTRPNAESFQGTQNNLGVGRSNYTLTEIQNLPYTMTAAQLDQLTLRMKKAGYFPSSKAGDNSNMPVPGMGDDPTFRTAWRTLIGEAVRTGKSMVDVLDSKSAALVGNGTLDADGNPVDKTRIQLTDATRIEMNAQAAASKLINRYLRPDELDAMVQFIHGLETTDSQNQTAFTNNGGTYTPVDVNSQIDNYIHLMMPPDTNNNGKLDKNEKWTPELLDQHLFGHANQQQTGDGRAASQDTVDWEQAAAVPSPSIATKPNIGPHGGGY